MTLSFDEYQELLNICKPEQLRLDTPVGQKFVELTLNYGRASEDEILASLPDYLTINEVAQVTGTAVTTLGQWFRSGVIKSTAPEDVAPEYRANLHGATKHFATPESLRSSESVTLLSVFGWNQVRAASVIKDLIYQAEESRKTVRDLNIELSEAKLRIYGLEQTVIALQKIVRDGIGDSNHEGQ